MSQYSSEEELLQSETPKLKILNVNNVNGLKKKLEEISLDFDWSERLCICVQNASEDLKAEQKDASHVMQDDFKREMLFYDQAAIVAAKAVSKLNRLGILTKRPDNYFAEMAKDDSHMIKIGETLLRKRAAMEKTFKMREIHKQKKLGKKVQIEVLEQRKIEKKKMITALKKAKKGKISAENLLKGEKRGFVERRKGAAV